ncbi:MAG TPA: ATP-binding protein [Thermoanaerobaculia bacterium]|nr:ATP-binding protein [Thermoanaerobaculia bacterium]
MSQADVILDAISAGVVAADRMGVVIYANRAARREFQLTADEIVGRSLRSILPVLEDARSVLAEVPCHEARHQVLRLRAGTTPKPLGFTIVRVEDPADGIAAIVLLRELGEVAALEEERRRSERSRAVGSTIAGLAHQLRNPLASIQALADGLLDRLGPADPGAEYATRILAATRRMEAFVQTAVRFAQAGAGAPARAEASELAAEARRRVGRDAGAAAALSPEERPLFCHVDRSQVIDCLERLLTNACEAATLPSAVRVSVGRRVDAVGKAWAVLEVVDDGPGIAESRIGHVFEPFYTTKPNHLGMGLAFAQRDAAQNGGRIEVASQPDQGSVFALWLPEAQP